MSSVYIDLTSRKPIYEQLVENISRLALTGVFAPNDPVPSVRQLASELGINPNTIQKSYSELERRGIIYSVKGKASFISENLEPASERRKKELTLSLASVICEAREIGMTKDELISAVSSAWSDSKKGEPEI